MRILGLCGGVSFLAFILGGYQAGLFRGGSPSGSAESTVVEEQPKAKKAARARFPEDLAPAARAEPVPRAAAFNTTAKTHRLVFLKANGSLYEDWQDRLKEEWRAESVEDASLVIVLGPHKKQFIEIIHYPNGAPPISRYKYELEVSAIEAKTGKILANRLFVNMPRNIQRIETWEAMSLGSPVEFRTVYHWAASAARAGFPPTTNSSPIVNVVN